MNDIPVPVEKKPVSKRIITSSIVALSLLVLGGLIWFFGTSYFPTARPISFAISALQLPKDLHDARFILKPFEYRRTSFGYEALPVESGIATAMDRGVTAALRLSKTPEGTLSLKVDGADVFTSELPIALPSISPDGFIIAYSQSISISGRELAQKPLGENGLIEPTISTSFLYYPASKKTVLLGTGAGPLFVDNKHILRFAPGGIIATDLSTGSETVLLEKSTSALGSPVLQSPDRSLISITDRILGKTYVYRVTATSLETVAELDATFVPSVLSNEALYELRSDSGKKTLWKHPFDGSSARKVTTFPDLLKVEALSL